jgi:SAM-dependent methyltransferase
MIDIHEANRHYWNGLAQDWQDLRDRDRLWRRCPGEPDLAFDGAALEMIREFAGDLRGKRACVIGSGDNYAAFALAGMGAAVTSTDISEEQLAVAAQRARELGLEIEFVRCDAADLGPLPGASLDLVCSTNGLFVWIAQPERLFAAVHRVLKEGGHYVFYDVHPFLRPWKDQRAPIEMEKPHFETGPFASDEATGPVYEFHWRLGDLLNALLRSGLALRKLVESPARDSRFWQDHAYLPGSDASLLDWRSNPRAGLPVWLTVAAQKPASIALSQGRNQATAGGAEEGNAASWTMS